MTNTTPEAVAEMVEKLTTKTGRTFRYQAAAMLTALSAEVERLKAYQHKILTKHGIVVAECDEARAALKAWEDTDAPR